MGQSFKREGRGERRDRSDTELTEDDPEVAERGDRFDAADFWVLTQRSPRASRLSLVRKDCRLELPVRLAGP